MALSGTINGSVTQKSSYFSFYLTWSATQNVAGNYSDVTVNTYWKTNNTYHTFDTVGSRSASITINGTTSSISKVFSVYWSSNPYLIQTATQRVYHNNDGTKSITISARANGHAASYGPSSSTASSADCTASGTITLNTIPRASSFGTISGNTIGSNMTVNINRNSSSFTHQLWYKLGNSSWYDLGAGIGTQKTFTISNDLLSQLPSSTSGTLQLCIRTYNGSTQIGSDVYKNVTVYVASSVVPKVGTITFNPADINSQNILVQGKNKLTISVSGCSAGTGSTIKSYTFSGPGISSTTTSTSVTSGGTISNTGTLTYTVKVTDNRGRTASKTATIVCHAWSAPTIVFDAHRVSSATSTAADDSGTFIRCTYTVKYSYVNNTNSRKSFSISGGSGSSNITYNSWTKTQTTGVNGVVTETGSAIIKNCPITNTYNIYATVVDNYSGNSTSNNVTVFSAERILNVRKNGSGIAFGKMADTDNLFDVKWPAKFNDTLTVGTSTQSAAPSAGIAVHDVRNVSITPNSFGDKNANFYFSQISGVWNSVLHMKGWSGEYAAWELAGNAHNTSRENSLRYRQGLGSTWGAWQKIVTSVDLYSSSGTAGTIQLSQSAANFTCLEIFYVDNTSQQPHSVRVYSPDGKRLTLSCIEPRDTGTTLRMYLRSMEWNISGTVLKPGVANATKGKALYCSLESNGNASVEIYRAGDTYKDSSGNTQTRPNYIKIVKVIGYV